MSSLQPSAPSTEISDSEPTPTAGIKYLVAALWMSVLFDRTVVYTLFASNSDGAFYCAVGVFWSVVFATVMVLFWREVTTVRSRYAAFLGFAFLTLAAWLIINGVSSNSVGVTTSNSEYAFTTIPAMLVLSMLFANQALSNFSLFSPGVIVAELLRGWFVRPFNRIARLRNVRRNLPQERSVAVRIGIGIVVSGVLLAVLIPLLMSADQVFSDAVSAVFSMDMFASFVPHLILVVVMTPLVFSLLWNLGAQAAKKRVAATETMKQGNGSSVLPVQLRHDTLVPAIVLGALNCLYALFCAIQFTFLFAREGLPAEYTYSEYARQGFWQLLAVEAINLAVFGAVVALSGTSKLIKALQGVLMGATAIMVASAVVRLSLYIDAYGLTWLRLAAFMLICYSAVLLVLCTVRIFTARLPLMAVGFAVGVVIYIVFGFMNPDALILHYNLAHGVLT